jgi:hypothetical protein
VGGTMRASLRVESRLVTLAGLLLVAAACGGGGQGVNGTSAPAASDDGQALTNAPGGASSPATHGGSAVHRLGEAVVVGNTTVAILGWDHVQAGPDVPVPSNMEIIAVDVEIQQNATDGSSVQPDLYVLDASGASHASSDSVLSGAYLSGGHGDEPDFTQGTRAGGRVRGQIAFVVPIGCPSCRVSYRPVASQVEPALFDLGATAQDLEPPAELSDPAPGTVQLGEAAGDGEMSVAVLGWKASQCGIGASRLPCVVLDVAMANTGQAAYPLMVGLSDTTGQAYRQSYIIGEEMRDPMLNLVTVAPGERLLTELAYYVLHVPDDLVFHVQSMDPTTHLFTDRKELSVALGAQPATAALAAGFPGEFAPNPAPVGQPLVIGDITVTVTSAAPSSVTEYGTPAPGTHFVLVDLRLSATGTSQVMLVNGQLLIEDQQGDLFFPNPSVISPNILSAHAAIQPGESFSGQAGYQVPAGGGPFRLVIRYQDGDQNWHSGFLSLPAI